MAVYFFDRDPWSGAVSTFEYDEANDIAIIHRKEDVEPILEHNKKLATEGNGYSPDRSIRRAASIPMGVVALWKEKYGVDIFNKNHEAAVRRLLNSNEWAYLRTAPGRL